jgi:hypothetical protein
MPIYTKILYSWAAVRSAGTFILFFFQEMCIFMDKGAEFYLKAANRRLAAPVGRCIQSCGLPLRML